MALGQNEIFWLTHDLNIKKDNHCSQGKKTCKANGLLREITKKRRPYEDTSI